MKVSDLTGPVTAAKSDYILATEWMGFTPIETGVKSAAQCQATIVRQMGNGYVLEYIVENIEKPNPKYADDPRLVAERAVHAENKGRLVAVHRLWPTASPLADIVGPAEFERIQNVWGQNGDRKRWSVAFPIVESFEVVGRPLAKPVFGEVAYRRLFQRSSRTLRDMDADERKALAGLELAPRAVANARFAIEAEVRMALGSPPNKRLLAGLTEDLASAMEGEPEDRKVHLRRRAAWLADKFVRGRQKAGTLQCDQCALDPSSLPRMFGLSARSLLDAHHLNPLDEGKRRTTEADFCLLCPTCHRLEHLVLKAAPAGTGQAA